MRKVALAVFLGAAVLPTASFAQSQDGIIQRMLHGSRAREALIRRMINESRASYRGTCPCPYDLSADGTECGKRSAYNLGERIKCYPSDLCRREIRAYTRGK